MNIFSETLNNVLKKKTSSGDGSYGEYVPYSMYRGIKILHGEYGSIEEAMESKAYDSAYKEMDLLVEAKKRGGNVPKCYGVKILKLGEMYQIGIVLQHLGNMTLLSYRHNCDPEISIIDVIKVEDKKLESIGVNHLDLHSSNIMRFKKKWWVIDFSPEYISIA